MNVQQLDEEFKEFIYTKYPDVFESVSLAVYKRGAKGKESPIDLNSPAIINLINSFYKIYMISPNPKHYTAMYNLVRQLTKRVGDDANLMRLKFIYATTCDSGFPLPIVEKIVFRDTMSANFTVNKKYNYGRIKGVRYHRKPSGVRLGDLIKALDDAEVIMMDIFHQICAEQDIPMDKFDFANMKSELPSL